MAIFPNLSRRQLLSTATTITVGGIAPNVTFDAHARSEIAQQAQALAPSSKSPSGDFIKDCIAFAT
jgi:hypothetical protein